MEEERERARNDKSEKEGRGGEEKWSYKRGRGEREYREGEKSGRGE